MSCRLALSVGPTSISMEIFVVECQKSIGAGLKTCWHVSVSEITVSFSESRHKLAGRERGPLRVPVSTWRKRTWSRISKSSR